MQTFIDLLQLQDNKLHLNDYHIHVLKYAIDYHSFNIFISPLLNLIVEYCVYILPHGTMHIADPHKDDQSHYLTFSQQQKEASLRKESVMKFDYFGHFANFLQTSKPNQYEERCLNCKDKYLSNCTHRIPREIMMNWLFYLKDNATRETKFKILWVVRCKFIHFVILGVNQL